MGALPGTEALAVSVPGAWSVGACTCHVRLVWELVWEQSQEKWCSGGGLSCWSSPTSFLPGFVLLPIFPV